MISTYCSHILTRAEFRTADAVLTICDDYNTFRCGQESNARDCCNSDNRTIIFTPGSRVVSCNFPPPQPQCSGSSVTLSMATATSTVTVEGATVTTTMSASTLPPENCSTSSLDAVIALGTLLLVAIAVLTYRGQTLLLSPAEAGTI